MQQQASLLPFYADLEERIQTGQYRRIVVINVKNEK